MKLTFHPVDIQPLVFEIEQDSFVIGRSSTCEVAVVVEGISRQHCKVELIDGDLYLTDLGSTNGVFIDGRRIPTNTPVRYNTFLPLSIGAIPSVNIEIPTGSNIGIRPYIQNNVNSAAKNDFESLSRTKVMTRRPELRPAPVEVKKSGGRWIINLIALLILGGGIAAFFLSSQEEELPTEAVPTSTPVKAEQI